MMTTIITKENKNKEDGNEFKELCRTRKQFPKCVGFHNHICRREYGIFKMRVRSIPVHVNGHGEGEVGKAGQARSST